LAAALVVAALAALTLAGGASAQTVERTATAASEQSFDQAYLRT